MEDDDDEIEAIGDNEEEEEEVRVAGMTPQLSLTSVLAFMDALGDA